ncbi:MAG: cobyrinate a,c-diamide synthase [Clostridiales bacterium]|nr:cobyrinate a,c-diamide synthase [Clostridiales bacterium]
MLHLPRLMLAAPGSGSGKTMITCGMLQAFCERGLRPASFKCGPDYIDPMFHTRVIGTPSRNLDTFFTDPQTTRYLFARTAQSAGISILEGVMGLYDGLGGISMEASSYDLAAVTETPVILIVNARGMSLSVIPLIQGYLNYQSCYIRQHPDQYGVFDGRTPGCDYETQISDKAQCIRKTQMAEKLQNSGGYIRGVILNQTTKMTYLLLKEEIEKQTGVHVYGYVPKLDDAAVESRHLGLVTPDEIADLKNRLSRLGEALEQCLDLDRILALAQDAADYEEDALEMPESAGRYVIHTADPAALLQMAYTADPAALSQTAYTADATVPRQMVHPADIVKPVRIAVARDDAFCFYYQDNLDLLEMLGAELVFFSPLRDAQLPEGVGGLLLGGGYPELYAKQLSENTAMKRSISSAIENGLPYLAECGGFMYLHEEMEDMEGRSWPMCGCISGRAYRTEKLGRFGYIMLSAREKEALQEGFLKPGETIRAHEFHYFDSTDPGNAYMAKKPAGKRTWDCVHSSEHSAAGYPHLYYWSNPAFAARFVSSARRYRSFAL